MAHLDAFLAIAVAFLAILVMVIASKEIGEVRQRASMDGSLEGQTEVHEDDASEADTRGFVRGLSTGLQKGREIGVRKLTDQILEGIRRFIYICGEDVKDREGYRDLWAMDMKALDVELSED